MATLLTSLIAGGIPLFLAFILATGKYRPLSQVTGRHSDIIVFFSTAICLCFLLIYLPWSSSSTYLRWPVAALLLFGLVRFFFMWSKQPERPASRIERLSQAATLALGVLTAAGVVFMIQGRSAPEEAVELVFPLKDGRFVVGQGGGNKLLNYHYSYRPQRYALDIVAVNALGIKTNTLLPMNIDDFVITDSEIVAPCSGEVVFARNGLEDAAGAQRERERPAGNMVALQCGEVVVMLAHMRRSSVAVRQGQTVEVGDLLGRVGNSGNTTEPHLHIHAERGEYMGEASENSGVAIVFDGRFLVRNDVVQALD